MPEPYGTLGATVPESDDYASGQADVPRAFREFSDSLGEGQGAGKLLIVQNTGAAAWKAMSGDVSINSSGVTQIGNNKLATGMYQDGSVTSQKFKPTMESKVSSANLSLTEAFQDIAGTIYEVTPPVASKLFLIASFRMLSTSGGTARGTVNLDGSDEPDHATLTPEAGKSASATVGQIYMLTLSAATKHTIKLRAKRETGSGECLAAKWVGFIAAS